MVASVLAEEPKPPSFPMPQFPAATWNVRDYGAVGDGVTNDTAAINRTIDQCNAGGGGSVLFPKGTYNAASIHLKSNVRLTLDANAVIVGAATGYDPPEPNPFERYQDFGHSHFHNALMWGDNIENFAITGGKINGGHIIEGEPGSRPIGDKVIAITNGRNLLFDNITHERGGHFVYLLNNCENVTIASVTVKKSRDGINLVNCRNVQVHDSNITGCGDDTLAVKTDYALGRKIESRNIYVWNCNFESACNALQIGSESIGDFRNINFWNIRIGRAWRAAIGITTVHGGIVDGVNYRDITVRDAACPIFLRVGNKLLNGPNLKPGTIKDVNIANVNVADCKKGEEGWPRTSFISGRSESPLEHIELENVKIVYRGGGRKEKDAPDGVGSSNSRRPLGSVPAAGFYIRYVNGLVLKNVDLEFEKPDARPLIAAQDIGEFQMDELKFSAGSTATKLRLEKITNLTVTSSPGLQDRTNETVSSTLEE